MTGDRNPTDEPDGTPAYAASLRAPGDSISSAQPAEATDEQIAPDRAPTGDDPYQDRAPGGVAAGAGYDADAVSGDTDVYRPE